MKYLIAYVKTNAGLTAWYLFAGILISLLSGFNANYLRKLVDRFTDGSLSIGTIAVFGVLLASLCALSYLDEYPWRKIEYGIHLDLKLAALRKIARIDYLACQSLGTGRLIQRIENGAAAGKGILFDFGFRLVRDIIPSIVFSMVFISRINRTVMLTILAGYVIVFLFTNLLLKALYRIKEQILVNEEKMSRFLVRGFMEMVVFRLNRRFPSEIRKAQAARDEIVTSKVRMKMIHEAFFAVFAMLIILVKVAIILYGWQSKTLSIGAIIALITLVDNAYTPIAIFNVLFVQYRLDRTAFRRYEEFLESPDDAQIGRGDPVSDVGGDIIFSGIQYRYEGRVVLDALDLTIRRGESVAIVGESGSGKSTVVKLLAGLLKPEAGEIRVDGILLSAADLDSYYAHIAYIPQDSPVFDGSLRENLVFDESIGDAEMVRALREVSLSDLLDKLENGLDTQVGEKGHLLSGGERQRLALARLWFSQAGIVILDEATSAMDNITEEHVMARVMRHLRGRTVVAIAHRLGSIADFQRILVFKDGRIVGQGTLPALMADCPYFRELYRADPAG